MPEAETSGCIYSGCSVNNYTFPKKQKTNSKTSCYFFVKKSCEHVPLRFWVLIAFILLALVSRVQKTCILILCCVQGLSLLFCCGGGGPTLQPARSQFPHQGLNPWKRKGQSPNYWCLPWWLRRESVCLQCGRLGLIPGWGRFSGEGNGNPLQYSCLENPTDGGAWQATVHGVTKSQT